MNKEKFLRILKEGLDFNQYILLELLSQKVDVSDIADTKVGGWKLLLQKKGYVYLTGELTQKGWDMLTGVPVESNVVVVQPPAIKNWAVELHEKLQGELVRLTGKKQKTIAGKYSFLPNAVDLGNRLSKIARKYSMTREDLPKIEQVLLQHIRNSHKAQWQYTVLIEYYIYKNDVSRLKTDLDNLEDVPVELNISDINVDL